MNGYRNQLLIGIMLCTQSLMCMHINPFNEGYTGKLSLAQWECAKAAMALDPRYNLYVPISESSASDVSPSPSCTTSVTEHKLVYAQSKAETKKPVCPTCKKIFYDSKTLKRHMLTHLPHDQRPFECLELGCAQRFCQKTHLKRHLQRLHAWSENDIQAYLPVKIGRPKKIKKVGIAS